MFIRTIWYNTIYTLCSLWRLQLKIALGTKLSHPSSLERVVGLGNNVTSKSKLEREAAAFTYILYVHMCAP